MNHRIDGHLVLMRQSNFGWRVCGANYVQPIDFACASQVFDWRAYLISGHKKTPAEGCLGRNAPVNFLNSLQRIYPPVAHLSTPLARSLKMSVRLKATTRSFLRLALRASVAAAYALTRTAAPQSLAPAIK